MVYRHRSKRILVPNPAFLEQYVVVPRLACHLDISFKKQRKAGGCANRTIKSVRNLDLTLRQMKRSLYDFARLLFIFGSSGEGHTLTL